MEQENTTNKPSFVSEYNMGSYDFQRFDLWLRYTEQFGGEISSCDVPTLRMIQGYFSGLNSLYLLWRPLITVPDIRKKYDDKISKCQKLKRKWENSIRNNQEYFMGNRKILEIVDLLGELHRDLMESKQIIGLGLNIRQKYTDKEKLNKGMLHKN